MFWKGRLVFKQYIPSKRSRFSIKLFIISHCKTKYILDFFIIYTGADTDRTISKDLGAFDSIVMKLIKQYLHKNHILFIDNWYSSPTLFEELKWRKKV